MTKIKKAVVLVLAILTILLFANSTFASTIQPKNDTVNNTPNNNTSVTPANNTTNNTSNIASNNISNNASNALIGGNNNVYSTPINTTNSSGNLPNTGIDSMYLNFALILLLTLVLGMFSLVQYNKIVKKEDEE